MLPPVLVWEDRTVTAQIEANPYPSPKRLEEEKKKAGLSDKKTAWILQLTLTRSFGTQSSAKTKQGDEKDQLAHRQTTGQPVDGSA